MSSLVKAESSQSGSTYLKEIGKTDYTWNIKNFKDLAVIGRSIRSPVFTVEVTDPSRGSFKVVSFRLAMHGSDKSFNVTLVKVSDYGSVVVKVPKVSIPQHTFNADVTLTFPTTFEIWRCNGRRIFEVAFTSKNLPDDLTIELEVSLHQAMQEIN